MKKWHSKYFSVALFLIAINMGAQEVPNNKSEKPMNVVFILADDLGWSDTELYGTTKLYETPNILRLAERGMTFTRAYANSPLCSPTRASILTGQTPSRHGSTSAVHHKEAVRLKPEYAKSTSSSKKAINVESVSRLDPKIPTLGQQVHKAGYATAHFGKWHLGPEPYSPYEHGFTVDIPHTNKPGPVGGFIGDWRFANNITKDFPEEHIEDRMSTEAINWMKSLPKGGSFFMNYWQFSVHAPFNAKPKLVEKYKKRIDPNSPQKSPTYAAMVESLDDAVGALMDALDTAGIADRTIVVFISDNGGNIYNKIPQDGNVRPTSNFPLRGGKACVFEGGIRVPAIVVWPGVTEPGSRSDEIIQTSDFYPTLLNGLGIALPKNHKLDGVDLMPALLGDKLMRDAIFTYFPTAPPVPEWLPTPITIHSGDWKLIRIFHGAENGAHDYRLYNLAEDISEENDLTDSYPDKVKKLDAMIEAHLKESGTLVPMINPDFDSTKYRPENIGLQPDDWKTKGNQKGSSKKKKKK
tara:strand:- start:11059 stop:12630 length:1572 start_codon:yes stop_codon:yes gene_type:complete